MYCIEGEYNVTNVVLDIACRQYHTLASLECVLLLMVLPIFYKCYIYTVHMESIYTDIYGTLKYVSVGATLMTLLRARSVPNKSLQFLNGRKTKMVVVVSARMLIFLFLFLSLRFFISILSLFHSNSPLFVFFYILVLNCRQSEQLLSSINYSDRWEINTHHRMSLVFKAKIKRSNEERKHE